MEMVSRCGGSRSPSFRKAVIMAIRHGQILKKNIAPLQNQMTDWQLKQADRLKALKPEFVQWVESQCDEVRQRIADQDYWFAVSSQVKHIQRQLRRMELGEIIAVSEDGMGFTINREA
jgi:hypothetical protein